MTDLSPAAQAVFDATGREIWCRNDDIVDALRALADQVVPKFWHEDDDVYGETMQGIRQQILAIADELGGDND